MQSEKIHLNNLESVSQQVKSIDHFVSQTAYSHWANAVAWIDDGTGAVFVKPASTTPAHWHFLGAAEEAGYIYYYLRRPENWHRGHLEFVLHWGGSNATGTYAAGVGYSFAQHNNAFPAWTDNVAALSVPTAGTANLLIARPKDTVDTNFALSTWASDEVNPKAVGAFASTVPPIHDGLHIRFGRDTTHESDTSVGHLRFYGMEILFFPHEGSVGHGMSRDYYRDDTRI